MTVANPYFHGNNAEKPAHDALKRKAALAGLCMAVTLIVCKFLAYLTTNSVSLLSSLMDSVFDAAASLITLLSLTHAATPADEDHRFGHGKIEALSALAQALFMGASAIFLFAESARRFFKPVAVTDAGIGLGVMILSIVLTAALIAYQKHVIRQTQSLAIRADHLHYSGDLWMNAGVLAALGLGALFHWPYFDPLFAIAIATRLGLGAFDIVKGALDILLDRETTEEERTAISALIMAHQDVRGLHDLRTRHSGERLFMEFHIEVDPDLSISAVHDIMDDIERRIFETYPRSEVLIHPEPAGLDDHRIDHKIGKN
jgi:ferrous-iron efflux pump FieF